ncbi:RND family efflux transporter, MFP subunit [Altererythrobacter xiamenensis]|uniref:RND family efflux transporter, MFP subunit n=1 Tax=Altererythrobacter xiamenensis TaxID=1316679 RepID=A0A1Y6F2M6_9SPHN|nr:efflux RND transporter periplasmic adaptor subunit [Altererythrobacter xiamenensis]SMQ69104.1 RND family efflux transporter, MFP subunit [Altererythrobacter xiamenensis]
MNYETNITGETKHSIASDIELDDGYERSNKTRWIIGGIILLIGALALAYFLTSSGEGAPAAAGDDRSQLPSVTVVTPGTTTVEGTITAPGTLAARREMPVGVVGEGGRVVSVPVDAGDWVRQGQVLAVIDRSVQNQQAQSAAAQIQVAQADANLAQSNLDRALQLVERGFISKADVDRLTATRDAAVARVNVAQAQLRELRARNARLNIIAPASGLLLERNVEPGQTVSGGSAPLFRIAKGGEMEMLAEVSESQLASLSTGVPANVVPTGTEKQFTGQVWQLSPVIDPQNRQGTARIALSYAPELRPGGFATATINSGTVVAPVLPESAVLSDNEGAYVFVIDNENKAVRRSIRTGMVTNQGITIAEGLDGSEKVVLRAGGFLTEGETVNPVAAEAGEG